jgi:hypothetical protein
MNIKRCSSHNVQAYACLFKGTKEMQTHSFMVLLGTILYYTVYLVQLHDNANVTPFIYVKGIHEQFI